jgi:predicted metalloprotease
MRWDREHRSSNVDDRRGESSGRLGGAFPMGGILAIGSRFGWKGILIALLVVGGLTYGSRMCVSDQTTSHVAPTTTSKTAEQDELPRFVGFVLDDVQSTFAKQIPSYHPTRLTLFRRGIESACGTASTAVGPFYCPIDRKVYIDLTFYDELRNRFGAPGDFAQAYVIAHEVGHHVQNQAGLLGKGEVQQVEIELQADCLAGAWAKDAERRGLLEVGDVDEALNAAAQIGDDTIQRKTTGRVQPETWTHGSAAQRSNAFKRGMRGGIEACGIATTAGP